MTAVFRVETATISPKMILSKSMEAVSYAAKNALHVRTSQISVLHALWIKSWSDFSV